MRSLILLGAAGLAFVFAANSSSAAETDSRQVMVNGEVLNSTELLGLDTLNCGATVPDGRYWLNINGAWGYQGGPQEGVIGSPCRAAPAAQNQQSACEAKYKYWEDRMAYCHGVSAYENPVYR